MLERPGRVPRDPTNPYRFGTLLADDAPAHDPELPVGDVEHFVLVRIPLGLHGEDEHLSPDLLIEAELVGSRIPGTPTESVETEPGVSTLRPALQESGALDLDRGSLCRPDVEVVPSDTQTSIISHRPGYQILGQDASDGVLTQVTERPPPKVQHIRIKPDEPLAATQPFRRTRDHPGYLTRGVRQFSGPSIVFLRHSTIIAHIRPNRIAGLRGSGEYSRPCGMITSCPWFVRRGEPVRTPSVLVGCTVWRTSFDYQVRLTLGALHPDEGYRVDAELVVEVPFLVRDTASTWHELDPGIGSALAPVLDLFQTTITAVHIGDTGALTLAFDSGAELIVTPHQQFEAWSLTGYGVDPIAVGPGGERDWLR
jgi:hypothetical protein